MFPDTIGVVGATHLPVATPRNCGTGYTNSSGWNSIVLLGVAGYNNKLGYVCIGQPGSTDNTAVLKASQLYKTAQKGKLFPADEDLHFLADHTFPLQNWLLTPYRPDEVCQRESYKTLNQHLKNAHKCVDTSFERLKGKMETSQKKVQIAHYVALVFIYIQVDGVFYSRAVIWQWISPKWCKFVASCITFAKAPVTCFSSTGIINAFLFFKNHFKANKC